MALEQIEKVAANADFQQSISRQIWHAKYQFKQQDKIFDHTVSDTWKRVANGLARTEAKNIRNQIADAFYNAMSDFSLVPAGRILSGTRTGRNVTLCNTFVLRTIPDSIEGIMDTVKDAARTMQMGGGVGFDFSTIRPKGALVAGLDCPAAGPLAAMDICDAVCRMVVSGMGRGAMMATMRCDHPDIIEFVSSKSDPKRFRNFNNSVMVTDKFIAALEADIDWNLIWNGEVVRTVPAKELWHLIMKQTYHAAEPGVLFIDQINARNPLQYIETLAATNSCAEQPLPPNGVCPLASVNLARLVDAPFSQDARLNIEKLKSTVTIGVRLLDNVLDVTKFAVPAQKYEAHTKRRIGLGVTGVGDALAMLGTRYGSSKAVFLLGSWMQTIQNVAYLSSAQLAEERGAFPSYDPQRHLTQPVITSLDHDVRRKVQKHGLRNGVITTIAPTGTTSMFAGNVSSGIEPIFANSYRRRIKISDSQTVEELILDYAVWLHQKMFGKDAPLPDTFVTTNDLSPDDHIRMQAAAQAWVDSGISKTINCPEDISFAEFEDIYRKSYAAGCKGCTTFRPNPITGSVVFT